MELVPDVQVPRRDSDFKDQQRLKDGDVTEIMPKDLQIPILSDTTNSDNTV